MMKWAGGHSTIANVRLGLFALYLLRSMDASTQAAHLHLSPLIAGINNTHIYKVLSAMKWLW